MAEVKANTVDLPAFYGVKAGMTRIFDESGNHVPVTVIKIIPNIISQVKTVEKDGYNAYQVAYSEKREKLVNMPKKGHLAKAKIKLNLNNFVEIAQAEVDQAALGNEVSLGMFILTPQTHPANTKLHSAEQTKTSQTPRTPFCGIMLTKPDPSPMH